MYHKEVSTIDLGMKCYGIRKSNRKMIRIWARMNTVQQDAANRLSRKGKWKKLNNNE